MAKFLLIGKDIPEAYDFAKGLLGAENEIFAAESDSNIQPDDYNDKISTASWNKASAISAHSFLIKAETKLEQIENVVFYFDADYNSTKFNDDRTDEISTAIDTLVTPFIYMAEELLKRAEQKRNKICVAFIVKNQNEEKNLNIVSIALAAFCQLAKNFAQNVADRDYFRVFLAKNAVATDALSTEQQLGEWTAKTLSEISESKKLTAKQSATWNKAGAKIGGGFPFFK